MTDHTPTLAEAIDAAGGRDAIWDALELLQVASMEPDYPAPWKSMCVAARIELAVAAGLVDAPPEDFTQATLSAVPREFADRMAADFAERIGLLPLPFDVRVALVATMADSSRQLDLDLDAAEMIDTVPEGWQ